MATTMRRTLRRSAPGLTLEKTYWDAGEQTVVGIDEVGRGAWAGPLTLAAVVAPPDRRIYKVRDSKLLTPSEREALFDRIVAWCDAYAIGEASEQECDELGMSAAQKLAARRAIEGLGRSPDRVLVDGNWDFVGGGRTRTVVKGDRVSLSIAAASVIAKVTRDRHMIAEGRHFPRYAFTSNKGYPCPRHRAALAASGPCAIHRRSWAFMDDLVWSGVPRRLPAAGQEQLFS